MDGRVSWVSRDSRVSRDRNVSSEDRISAASSHSSIPYGGFLFSCKSRVAKEVLMLAFSKCLITCSATTKGASCRTLMAEYFLRATKHNRTCSHVSIFLPIISRCPGAGDTVSADNVLHKLHVVMEHARCYVIMKHAESCDN